MSLQKSKNSPSAGVVNSRWAIVLVLVALTIALVSFFRMGEDDSRVVVSQHETTLERIRKSGVMRVGYGGFPPYTIVNPNEPDPNHRVAGMAVDIVNEIASRYEPPLKVEWKDLAWETFRADMLSGRFDFLADAVYYSVPRLAEFGITEPFSYFGIGAAVVSIDDDRFSTFEDLDQEGITIALAQGYLSTTLAQRRLIKPTLKLLTVGNTAFTQLDEVLFGRADVALNDIPTVIQYVNAHSDQVKALWVTSPPSQVAAGFVTRIEDQDLKDFLNGALQILKVDGTLAKIDKKWGGLGFYEEPRYIPGAGLLESQK